jgi:hypothetical protein
MDLYNEKIKVLFKIMRNCDSGYSTEQPEAPDQIYRDGYRAGFLKALDLLNVKKSDIHKMFDKVKD